MRQRLCRVCGGWHDLDKPWPDNCRETIWVWPSDYPSPQVVRDTMDPVQSMVDGKMYDSKRALRASYLPSGNKDGKYFVEVGNDPSVKDPKRKPHEKPKKQDVMASVGKAFSQAGLGA